MRKIKIYFPKADITCYATVLEDDFPELADELWEKIAQPMECEAHNTLSTGDYVQCRPIPPYHVPKYVGDQSNPLGGNKVPALCDCVNGDIAWSGWYFAAQSLCRIWVPSWQKSTLNIWMHSIAAAWTVGTTPISITNWQPLFSPEGRKLKWQ